MIALSSLLPSAAPSVVRRPWPLRLRLSPSLMAAVCAVCTTAQALPTEIFWTQCAGSRNWIDPCWRNASGTAVPLPQAGQAAYIRPSAAVTLEYTLDGSERPLSALKLDNGATLHQSDGVLVARETTIGGAVAGRLRLSSGLAQLGEVVVGGGYTLAPPARLEVSDGRLEATRLVVGQGLGGEVEQTGGRMRIDGAIDLRGRNDRTASLTLSGGRLEAEEIRASSGDNRRLSAVNLSGGTLSLSAGRLDAGFLRLADGYSLAIGGSGGDNRLQSVAAGNWTVGHRSEAAVVQTDGVAVVDGMRIGAAMDDRRALARYDISGGVLAVDQGLIVGYGARGHLNITGGSVTVVEHLALGHFDSLSEGRIQLSGGQLLAGSIGNASGRGELVQTGGALYAEGLYFLDLLHLGGNGQHDIGQAYLAADGVLELDGVRLTTRGALYAAGTLRLLSEQPALDEWLDVLDWGILEGSFDAVDTSAWALSENQLLALSRLYVDGTVAVRLRGMAVPLPGSMALALLALLALGPTLQRRSASAA